MEGNIFVAIVIFTFCAAVNDDKTYSKMKLFSNQDVLLYSNYHFPDKVNFKEKPQNALYRKNECSVMPRHTKQYNLRSPSYDRGRFKVFLLVCY